MKKEEIKVVRDVLGRFAAETHSWVGFVLAYPFHWAMAEFRALVWQRKLLLVFMILCASVPIGGTLASKFEPRTLTYTAPVVEAAEIRKDLTLEEAKAELDHIVWGGESGKYEPKEGEILPTFDPNKAMYASCIKIGGRMPKDCLSYGPRQEKIGTIQHYWPMLYGGVEISEKDARDVAEGLESSYKFFMDCSIKIKGCVWNWTTAAAHPKEVELLIRIIRKGEGIVVE